MNEVSIFKAVQKSNKIKDTSNDEILKHLTIVMLKVGIREKNIPSPGEKKILIDHIRKNFGNLPIQSIRAAFELLIDGKLNVPDHFDNFSCIYFSRVMNAYKSWENKVFRELPPDKIEYLPAPKMTDEELIKLGWDTWNELRSLSVIPARLYDLLKCNPSEDEIREAAKKVTKIINLKLLDNRHLFNIISREMYFDRMMKAYFSLEKLKQIFGGEVKND